MRRCPSVANCRRWRSSPARCAIAGGQLRGLALEGSWLGGPVEIESRRAAPRLATTPSTALRTAAPLLRLLGRTEAASHVDGQLSWSGTVQRLDEGKNDNAWKVSLASALTGVESRLPAPFDKPDARALPVSAQLRVDANGIRDFEVDAGVT